MKIPESLIEKLKPFGPRIIRVQKAELGNSKSGKRPADNGWLLNPFYPEDEEILRWGGNYGIVCGKGFIEFDFDTRRPEDRALMDEFPETFTVETGSGNGFHYGYMSDITDGGVMFAKDGTHVGDLQANGRQVVGPGSLHHSGGKYRITKDVPLAWISREDVVKIFEDSAFHIRWDKDTSLKNEKAATDEANLLGHNVPLAELIDLSEMRDIGGGEYQGAHPVHGSEGGQNFAVNVEKNCWHCFRCASGGGPLSWVAVSEGLIECHEAKPGKIRGALYRKVEALINAMGYELEEFIVPSHVPDQQKKYFKKRHFIPEAMVDEMLEEYPIKTLMGPKIYMYNKRTGVYDRNGEKWLEQIVKEKLGLAAESARVTGVRKLIEIETFVMRTPKVKPELVVVGNGLLNLRTGELGPYTPDEFMVARIPVAYDPEADMSVVEKFISEIVTPQDGQALQEFCGYCLWRKYFIDKAFMLVGNRRNGKSTFIDMLTAMLGGYENVSSMSLQNLTNTRNAMAQLEHKFANLCGELSAMRIRTTNTFKMLVGNDTVYAEIKFKTPRPFVNYAKLMNSCNDLPKVDTAESGAFYSKLVIIRFPNKFEGPNCDLNIIDKLTTPEALTGMLRWAVEGLHRLLKQGKFTQSQSSEEVEAMYTKLSDSVAYWIETFTELDGEYCTPKADVYSEYEAWCREEKLSPLSVRAFNKKMGETYTERRKTIDGTKRRVWDGCKMEGEVSVHQGGTLFDSLQ